MLRNTAGQSVAFQAISSTDGSAVTSGSPTVNITQDNGTLTAGAGTVSHKGGGQWVYAPTQAETDAVHVVCQFVLSGAITHIRDFYTQVYDHQDIIETLLTLGVSLTPNFVGTYFAPTYFPSAYFAPGYWGTGGSLGTSLWDSILTIQVGAGSGADSIVITISDEDGVEQGVQVWATSDAAGESVIAGTLTTNDSGQVTMLLDDGVSYYLWARKAGLSPIIAQAFIADAINGNSFTMATASAVTTGSYISESDIDDMFGVENVTRWSQLDPDLVSRDTSRVSRAIERAESHIDDRFRGSQYVVPITGTSGVPSKVKEWACKRAGVWLYMSRGHLDEGSVADDEATRMQKIYESVNDEIDLYVSGAWRLNAAREDNDQPTGPRVVV